MHIVSVLLETGLRIKYSRPLVEVLEVVLQVHELASTIAYPEIECFVYVAFHFLILLVPVIGQYYLA